MLSNAIFKADQWRSQGAKVWIEDINGNKQQNQHGGKADQQQGGGGQKPGQQQQQQPNQKPGQAGRQQEELDKKWRDVAEPGQEPGTGEPGT